MAEYTAIYEMWIVTDQPNDQAAKLEFSRLEGQFPNYMTFDRQEDLSIHKLIFKTDGRVT